MNISERFKGCIVAGAIGDAFGSAYENISKSDNSKTTFYPFGKPKNIIPDWRLTDDTQLTLATCETIIENEILKPEFFASKFLEYYQAKKITGIGASTLQALKGLEIGGHWSLVGRKGEFAAGNGAAMRVAPLGFEPNITRQNIKDICNITHQNDEAYVGSLCITIAIQSIINGDWTGDGNLLKIIINKIPDTSVRDRLIEIDSLNCDLLEIPKLGNNGYVVNSIPLAITYANKVKEIGIDEMFNQLIKIEGDTDTNCSIAGQIAGTLLGINAIPNHLIEKLKKLNDYKWIKTTIENHIKKKNWD